MKTLKNKMEERYKKYIRREQKIYGKTQFYCDECNIWILKRNWEKHIIYHETGVRATKQK